MRTQDHKQAARWYRLAANQGDALAQWNLGYMYRRGEGVLKDSVICMFSPSYSGCSSLLIMRCR